MTALLLETILPILVSLLICTRRRKSKIRIMKDKIVISDGKSWKYVAGLELTKIDPSVFNDPKKLSYYSKAIIKCCRSSELIIKLLRSDEDSKELIRKIENQVTTLRIILQEDPSNVAIEKKLRYLERLLKYVEKYPPSSIKVCYILASETQSALERDKATLKSILESMLSAEVKSLGGFELLKVLRYPLKVKTKMLPSSALLTAPPQPKTILDGMIFLGIREDGEVALISTEDLLYHVGVFGSTGSGKTTFLCDLIEKLTSLGVKTTVIDPKGDLLNMCKGVIEETYGPFEFSSLEKMKEVTNTLFSKILGEVLRMELTRELKRVVVIDEAWMVDQALLEGLLREARSRGTGIVLATHRPGDLNESSYQNIHTKVFLHMDKTDPILEKMGVADEVMELMPGEAIMMFRNGDVVKVKLDHATTRTTLKSSTPPSSNNFPTSFSSPSSSIKKKLGTTADL